MRKLLDGLYDGAAALAAVFMVGLLAMVLVSILGRQLHFHVPGTDAYAGYLMAAAGFLALAHTLKRGEHIRVTLLLSHLRGGRGARWSCGRWRPRLRWQRWRRSTACGWPGSLVSSTTSRPRNDATPLWIPQLAMAAGSVILLIALVDEWWLEWRGQRVEVSSDEALHNE